MRRCRASIPGKLCNKRLVGYLSWHCKRKPLYRKETLDAVLDDMRTFRPDHICVTGDLVNIALPQEFARIPAFLDTLGPREKISVIPGNHDAYVRAGEALAQRTFQPWMELGLPYVHRRGSIAFIGLSTAVATLPFIASGRLGGAQLRWLEKTLAMLRYEELARVVMLHHPPQPGAASRRKGLDDAQDFRAVIGRVGAEIVLHGHLHHPARASLAGPAGPVPVFGAGSASFSAAQYWIFRYDGEKIEAESRFYDSVNGVMRPGSLESLTIGPCSP